MIELKRLRLVNWHNFENVTFDCARLTYMIGVNAVGKTTILDAIRYCLTTNRNFNALGNKKSGRTLQGSVHAKQRGENAYRRPGHTVAYIGAEFWDSADRAPFVIAVRVESEGPMQELHPGDQVWYVSENGCTLEQLPFIDPRTGAPSAREDFKPAAGRLSYTRSPSEARDKICRALGIGRAASPLGKKFNEVFQMGTSMDEIPNFREFLYQYILPQPELDLEALQSDRVELENLHAVLAEARARAEALENIVTLGRQAEEMQTAALVNQGAGLFARAEADTGEDAAWQSRIEAGRRQLDQLNAQYEVAKTAEAEARRACLAAHRASGSSNEGKALEALTAEVERCQDDVAEAERRRERSEQAAARVTALLHSLQRSEHPIDPDLWPGRMTADALPDLTARLNEAEAPLEEAYFAARKVSADIQASERELRAELDAVSGGRWVYPHSDTATRVRDAVNAELQSRGMQPDARIFCELLTVADESWQDCVEACLGDRRFDILVPPAHYAAAKSAFVALKDQVGAISLLDTPGLRAANRRADSAPADSLAAQVTSENPLAAQYADSLLRRIVCCETADTLENYPDSATRDLLRHHPFRLERLRTPRRYIGLDARRARAEGLKAELTALAEKRKTAEATEQSLKATCDQLQTTLRGNALDELAGLWASRAALEEGQHRLAEQSQRLADCRENPMLRQLWQDAEEKEKAWEAARAAVERVSGDVRVCQRQLDTWESEWKRAVDTAASSASAAQAFGSQYPLLETMAKERRAALSPNARDAAQAAERSQAQLDDSLQAYLRRMLEPAQQEYNQRYVCDYPLGLAGLNQYRAQRDTLVRIDLERYAARLEQAQRDCKDRFRKDILFRMKDDIFNARRQFRELNRVMEQLTYGEEVYRFSLEPSHDPQLAAFYQVIVDKGNQQMTAGDSLDNIAATADPVYERQVDELMEKIMADVDANTQARQEGRHGDHVTLSDYVDYRTYLDYDIRVTNQVSGQQASLSRVSRDSSGGENQAPFYVAICASLLQIYQKSENSIRLVLLDEAFSKMTSDRIRPMMELFRRMQLQVILISTVEKSTAIQPCCDITYSIVRHGDANAIAPFYHLAPTAESDTDTEASDEGSTD